MDGGVSFDTLTNSDDPDVDGVFIPAFKSSAWVRLKKWKRFDGENGLLKMSSCLI